MSRSAVPLTVVSRLFQRTFINWTRTVSLCSSQTRMNSTSTSEVTPPVGDDLQVQHDDKHQEFVISLGTDHRAILQYTHTLHGAVDLWHTEVPPVFRGKGVAKLLAQAAAGSLFQSGNSHDLVVYVSAAVCSALSSA